MNPTVAWFEEKIEHLQISIGDVLKRKNTIFEYISKGQLRSGIDEGKRLTERVIEHLALPKRDIRFEFKKLESSVAGTVENTGLGYLVSISQELQDNFRALSAILVHELMHIYLGNR
ncbi:MAG: hypothetical protein KKF80_01380, partial [Candidatus Omnitrophica bacterium]|nr:hypothetical protein [Candidatus Omnitrophota bacterium]